MKNPRINKVKNLTTNTAIDLLHEGRTVLHRQLKNEEEIEKFNEHGKRVLEDFDQRFIKLRKESTNKEWLLPKYYRNMDVETEIVRRCQTNEEINRVKQELELFKKYNLINLLRTCFYVVNKAKESGTIIGIGRGSSVASYVLYLIGIHRVDSIKYNLPLNDFFKE